MAEDLLERIPSMEREAEELERKALALRQIIEGVRALNGDAEALLETRFVQQNGKLYSARPLDESGPRGREAVRLVMSEDSDRHWKVVELKREILRRGWAPSPKAVEASVKRMAKLGEIEPVRYGYYKLVPAKRDESVAEPRNIQGEDGDVR